MKQLIMPGFYKRALMLVMLAMTRVITWGQDSTMTSTTKTTTTTSEQHTWYAEPWVWGVGGVILLVVIILLVRGNGNDRSDKIIVTK